MIISSGQDRAIHEKNSLDEKYVFMNFHLPIKTLYNYVHTCIIRLDSSSFIDPRAIETHESLR